MNNEMEKRLAALADGYLDVLAQEGHTEAELGFDRPDKDEVVAILEGLRRIILPEYYRGKTYKYYTMRNYITMLLEDVTFRLIRQTAVALRFHPDYSAQDDAARQERAQELVMTYMERIPQVRERVIEDIQASMDGDPAAFNNEEIVFSYPGLYAILVYRAAHELHILGVPMLPRIMTELAHSATGIDIHPGAEIGRNFFIDHGTGIVIGETTIIGDNAKIYQGVTLGALSTRGGQRLKNKKRHPTLGNNVTVYSGASILGGETVIGDNAVIGGNAFITSPVPANAKVSIAGQELHYNYEKDELFRTTLSDMDAEN